MQGNQLRGHYNSGPGMDNGGLDQGGRRGNGEKWTVAEYVLEVELTELGDRLDVGREERIGIRMTIRLLAEQLGGWWGH